MKIGIDVGGTKTHLLFDRAGDGASLQVPTAMWCHGDLLSDPANAERLVALFSHELDGDGDVVVVGAHGCDNEEQRSLFEQRLRAASIPEAFVFNDSALLAPAAGLDQAIAVVVGTGSIVTGVDAAGETIFAGGYGGIFADPASAPATVREAARALLDAIDDGAPDPLLEEALFAHFGVDDHVDLALLLTTTPSITFWGAAAPVVFAAADRGSVLADAVIAAGAAELALGVHRVRRRGVVGDAVIVAGGVAVHQPRVVRHLSARLTELEPGLDVVLLTEPPATGALVLARRLGRTSPDPKSLTTTQRFKGDTHDTPQPITR